MSNDYERKTDRTFRENIVLEITIIAIIILTANNRRDNLEETSYQADIVIHLI